MDADRLAMLAGVVISLAFSYAPKLKDLFDKLEGNYKRLVMLGLMAVVAGSMFGLACGGIVEFAGDVTCNRAGVVELVWAFVYAAIANQAAYALSPKPAAPAPEHVDWADPR